MKTVTSTARHIIQVATFVTFPIVGSLAIAQEKVLLWGDTHLHTSLSTDGFGSGNKLVDPEQAYRYAKGMPILHPTLGTRMQIPRPLDFLVVADHSDYLGLQAYLIKDDPRLTATEKGRELQAMAREDAGSVFRLIFGNNPDFPPEVLMETYEPVKMQPWLDEIAAAEQHNLPGTFTAFAGWEWSSHEMNRNLHRVVFSPASAEKLGSFFPFSNLDSVRPEDLWQWLEATAEAIDSDFVAIPHNSNMSTGLMFDKVDSDSLPITAEYARTRIRWEPVMEVTQAKGTSEVHPALSTRDEFAEFEIFRRLFMNQEPVPSESDYARSALLRGLQLEQDTGVNPYKFGLIGSSDIHTGMVTVEENNFYGAVARDSLPATRQEAPRNRPAEQSAQLNAWELSASGLSGVWATENTRQAIFDAFRSKEVYATSGPRLSLRVFGGFNFQPGDSGNDDMVSLGYASGVAMGGDLAKAGSEDRMTLIVHATKDPEGANLDRVQVIKGWNDASGESQEAIFNVAWAGDRSPDSDGNLPAIDNTVNINEASYSNSIGVTQLFTVWEDPDFDASQPAFYYVRVLEIPTPRHQVYDAVALGMDPRETGQPLTIQERAWSSPIWYTP